MAPAGKKDTNTTPGRRNKRTGTDNQYFEVGKVGRKTGITLKDTGIRDEHGLEPVSGIFSSPIPPKSERADVPSSDEMDVQDSTAPDVERTLHMRRTPRLPPARQSTPRHTNIGSPKRMSSAKGSARGRLARPSVEHSHARSFAQPPNRLLDFGSTTTRDRSSTRMVENNSPFKPKRVLRRSSGPVQPDVYALEPESSEQALSRQLNGHIEEEDGEEEEEEEEDDVEQSIESARPPDEEPLMMENDDQLDETPPDQTSVNIDATEPDSVHSARSKRFSGTSRTPGGVVDNHRGQYTPPVAFMSSSSRSRKRNRESMDSERILIEDEPSFVEGRSPQRKKKGRQSEAAEVIVHTDHGTESIDPSLLAHGDSYVVYTQDDPGSAMPEDETEPEQQIEIEEEVQPEDEIEPAKPRRGRPKGKGKVTAPKQRDAKRATQAKGGSSKAPGSPSKPYPRGASVGPVSNVNLRATTPFSDAGELTSRFGRNLIQPLRFWENENRIWRNGEIEGIIRAEPVEKIQSKQKKRKKRRTNLAQLDGIEEESETESLLADDWEHKYGVITGRVAGWDPVNQIGDPDAPIEDDLAFAASSIVTRDVAGSAFKYAKILTMPFLGAGLVELPPGGSKRAKNSRKMHMIFFVHEGKVDVQIGATGLEVTQFNVTKGGVWSVPRGNNYALANSSRTRSAKVFFAQGHIPGEDEM